MTKVTAIIWSGLLEQAEAVLQELGVAGVIIQPVREYNRFGQLPREQRTDHLKIEFFVADDRAEASVDAIVDAANACRSGYGIVLTERAERVVHVGLRGSKLADAADAAKCKKQIGQEQFRSIVDLWPIVLAVLVIVAPFGVAPDVRLYYLAGLLLSVLGLLGVSSVNACL